MPISLAHDDSGLHRLRVAHELDKVRDVVGGRTIERRHIEVVHQTAGRLELDGQEERCRSQDAVHFDALRQSLSRRPVGRIIALVDVVLPEGQTRRVRLTIQEVVILLPYKCRRVVDSIRRRRGRVIDCDGPIERRDEGGASRKIRQVDGEGLRPFRIRVLIDGNIESLLRLVGRKPQGPEHRREVATRRCQPTVKRAAVYRRTRVVGRVINIDRRRSIAAAIDDHVNETIALVNVVVRRAETDQGLVVYHLAAGKRAGARQEVRIAAVVSRNRMRARSQCGGLTCSHAARIERLAACIRAGDRITTVFELHGPGCCASARRTCDCRREGDALRQIRRIR